METINEIDSFEQKYIIIKDFLHSERKKTWLILDYTIN